MLPDFRGPKGKPGSRGVYAGVPLHASYVCLHTVGGMDLDMQLELFALALDVLHGASQWQEPLETWKIQPMREMPAAASAALDSGPPSRSNMPMSVHP